MPQQSQRMDIGLLVLRIGLGLSFVIVHGGPKLFGGPAKWAKVGDVMTNFGINFAPTFWGFMATFAEFFGGFALIFGLFTRSAAALLLITMFVAMSYHLVEGDPMSSTSHALEVGIAFLAILITGPGRLSLDRSLKERRLNRDR